MLTIEYAGEVVHDPRDDGLPACGIRASLAVGSAGSLEFSLPEPNPWRGRFAKMDAGREVVLLDGGRELFRGRVTECSGEILPVERVVCEGQLAYLGDTVQRPYGTYADAPAEGDDPAWTDIAPGSRREYAEWLVGRHNAAADPAKRFAVGRNDLPGTPLVRSSTTCPKTRQELDDKLVGPFGVAMVARMRGGVRQVDFLSDGGRATAQRIELGANLLGFSRTSRAIDAKTCIVARGKDASGREFGLGALPDGPCGRGVAKQGDRILNEAAVAAYGVIEDVRAYECATPEGLLEAAAGDAEALALRIDSVEVSAIDLARLGTGAEPIELGDWVTVSARPLGFEAALMCSRIEVDGDDPAATGYVLGAELPALSSGGRSTSARIRAAEAAAIEGVRPVSAEAKAAARLAQAAVVASWDEYALGESGSDPPADGWSAETPGWRDGLHVWRRAVTAYGDGTTVEGAPAVMTGNAGRDGEDATTLYVDSSRGYVFKNNLISTVLRVIITKGGERITDSARMREVYGQGARIEWRWQRVDDTGFGVISSGDSRLSDGGFALTVSPDDVDIKTVFTATLII